MTIEIGILGELRLTVDGASVALGGRRQRSVLAILVLSRGSATSNDAIVDALWPDEPPPTASKTVQVYISRLRDLLGPEADRLTSGAGGYRLLIGAEELDAARFETLLRQARRLSDDEDHAVAASVATEALSLWHGSALSDFAYESFAQVEAARLEELRLQAVELRLGSLVEAGDEAGAITDLQRLVAEHPYRERLWQMLVVGLYRAGRQADALDAIRAVRRSLVEDLGIDPSPALEALEIAVLNQDPALIRPVIAPLAAGRVQRPLTSLIGREAELAALAALLVEQRHLTITGAGGTGKTRLAVELAERVRDRYPDGMFFVDLSPIRDIDLFGPTIASALGIDVSPDQTAGEALLETMHHRRSLLVLDNFEQLLGAAPAVTELLVGTRHLRVVVTSRAPLRTRGEYEFVLDPLGVVDPGASLAEVARSPAVRLFLDRAASDGSPLTIDPATAPLLAEMCRRLDGIPLAIELAAVHVRALGLEAILARLGERLDLVGGGRRDLPERQRTLRATLEWSYELLGRSEAVLHQGLAVFSGGFTLAAAEAVCSSPEVADPIGSLTTLVEHHLVLSRKREGRVRYGMLETIRSHAAAMLAAGEAAATVGQRHAEYFARLATDGRAEMRGPGRSAALERLSSEIDNIRTALGWCVRAGEADVGLKLAASLRPLWELHGQLKEGRRWLADLLALDAPRSDEAQADALNASGGLAYLQGDYLGAQQLFGDALPIRERLGDALGVASCLGNLATVADELGDHEQAARLMPECVEAWRRVGDPWGLAIALGNMASVLSNRHLAFDEAKRLQEEAVSLIRGSGDDATLSWALSGLGEVSVNAGDLAAADRYLREALTLARTLKAPHEIALALQGLGDLALERQEVAVAMDRYTEALAAMTAAGERLGVAQCLERVGQLLAIDQRPVEAATIWGCAAAVRQAIGAARYAVDLAWYEPSVAGVRAALEPLVFDDAWAVGERAEPAALVADLPREALI
jgi:predicted ATPase/DNA-binding SARP family transcriptional activator